MRGSPVRGVARWGKFWSVGVAFVCVKVRERTLVKSAVVDAVVGVEPV